MKEQTRLTMLVILMLVTFSMMIAIAAFAQGRSIQGRFYGKRPPLPLGVLEELTIPERIYNMSIAQGLSEYEANRMVRIADCESNFIPTAQNKHSSAAGLTQIIYSTWLANSKYPWSDRYDAVKNIDTAIAIYKRSGFSPWVCKGL